MNVRIRRSKVTNANGFLATRTSRASGLSLLCCTFLLLLSPPGITGLLARADDAVVVESGSDYRVWAKARETSDDGAPLEGARSGKIVEIATGMNYWDGDHWAPSQPQFELVANGFSASRMQHKVKLAENINRAGAVHIVTGDNVELKSTPLALALYDAASGRTLVIGTVTNSIGILVNATKVVYPSAFHGISADLVYTIDQSSFEQDVVITGALNIADYGFPPETTRIQVLTEFYDAPRPDRIKRPIFIEKDPDKRKTMATPDFIDETLGFGEFVLGGGRAFQEKDNVTPTSTGTPVIKEFKEIQGRTFLIESVASSAVASKRHASYAPRRRKAAGITEKIASLPIPPKQLASDSAAPQSARRVADAGFQLPKGITIDYRATVNTTIGSAKVFQGDVTYLVSGAVICNGSVTIEGGAVFKYKYIAGTGNAPYIKATTGFTCNTATYRPAIMTAVDDDSVGEPMATYTDSVTGYTGTINGSGYAGPALWLYNLSGPTANNLRIRYAQEGIRVEGNSLSSANVLNSQFVNCVKGIVLTSVSTGTGWSGSGFVVNNCLFTYVATPFCWNVPSWPTSAYNVTVDNVPSLNGKLISPAAGSTPVVKFVNSIFANVLTLGVSAGSISGGTNAFYNTTQFATSPRALSASPFQSRGGANYYLLDSGPQLRGVGVTLSSLYTAQIVNKTTYAPSDFANSVTGSGITTWSPIVTRDTAGKDLGYHYDPIDYLVNNMQVSANAQLTLSPGPPGPSAGVVVATYGASGLILKENATLKSEGTPYLHNHIVRYVVAQEQPVRLPIGAGTDPAIYKAIDPEPAALMPAPTINCRFTDFEGMSGGGYHIYGSDSGTTVSAMTLRDCSFNSAAALFGGPTSAMISINNNTFESCVLEFRYTPEIVAYNNLFRRGRTTIIKATSNNQWVFRDNIFDTITNSVSGDTLNLVHGKNGYFTSDSACPVTRLPPAQSSDILPNPFTYASPSTFGTFYQVPTSVFLDIGSRTAELAGLQHHTVLTAQTQEGPTGNVDIGFHYVSTSSYDTDSDGTPNYKEGPVITAPPSFAYWEGQFVTPFLNINSALNAQISDPHPPPAPVGYNGAILKVYMAEGGQSEDQFYLYLAANDPAFSGEGNYAAFSTSPADSLGDNLLLNGVIVGKIIRSPQPKGVYEWCASGTAPLQVTFNDKASVATLDALVKNVVYHNNSINPVTTTRVISILAKDGAGEWSLPSHTRLDITSLNSGPAASSFTVYTTPGTAINFALQGSDLETRPASALTYTISQQPSIGTVSQSGPTGQTILYTPPQTSPTISAVNTATFTYYVTDGNIPPARSADATVTIVIGPGGAPAISAGPDQTIFIGNWVSLGGLPQTPPTGMGLTWEKLSGPMPISFFDPNSADPMNPSLASNIGTVSAAGFNRPGEYLLQLKETSGSTIVASDTVNITAIQNKAPIVDAGPDRLLANGGSVTITGTAREDWQWGVSFQWYLLAGPGGYSIKPAAGASLVLNNLNLGTYVFRLTGTDGFGAVGTDEVTIRVIDTRGHTWTRNVDFEQGYLGDVTYDETPDALTISSERRTFPFIDLSYWASQNAEYPMVVRLDIDSAQVVGNFRAAPTFGASHPECNFYNALSDPSGDTWVVLARENGLWLPYAIRFGVVLGGVRGDRIGTAPNYTFRDNPFGEYLRPPFRYNSCIDRDGDGFIHTSRGGSQLFAWEHPEPLDGSYTAAQILATADDEMIKEMIDLDQPTLRFPTSAAIDSSQNIWFVGNGSVDATPHYQIYSPSLTLPSGVLGSSVPLSANAISESVINSQNHLWVAGWQHFYDVSTGSQTPYAFENPPLSAMTKGMAIDRTTNPNTIWFISGDDTTKVFKLVVNGSTATAIGYTHGVAGAPKFLTIDGAGNIWVVISAATDELYRMRNNGGINDSVVGKVETGCLSTIDAMGLDWKGRLWLAGDGPNASHNRVIRINPATGPIGTGDITIGAVEVDRLLNLSLSPIAGFKHIAGTEPCLISPNAGTWRTVHNAGSSVSWGSLTWTSSESSGATLAVKARAAATEAALASTPWQTGLTSGGPFPASGQFVEIQVTFNKGMNGTKPVLYDLTLTPQNAAVVIDEHRQRIVVDDVVSLSKNARPVEIDVLANDPSNVILDTVSPVSPARRGGVAVGANQKIVYTPPQGFSGIDRFVYKVTGASGSANNGIVDYGLVTVKISPLETPPVAHHLDGTLAASPNSPAWVAPAPNDPWAGSIAFSGSGNKKVTVQDSPWLNVGHDMTLTFRIYKTADLAADARIIGKGNSLLNQSFGVWDVAGSGDHHLTFQYRTTDGVTKSIVSDQYFTGNNQWLNIAITWSQGYVQFYFNGAPDGVSDGTVFTPTPHLADGIPVVTTDPLIFGYPGFGVDFNGRIDEVHLYNRELSNDEITEISNNPGLHVSSVGALVGRWSLDENSGSTAFDSSSANPIPDAPFTDPAAASYSLWAEHFGAATLVQSAQCKPAAGGHAPIAGDDFVTRLIRLSSLDTVETPISVLANDTDPDGDSIYLIDDFPRATTFGHVRKEGNNLYYLPSLHSYGIDRFQYTISDKNGIKANGTVKVFVAPMNPLPTLTLIQSGQVSAAAVTQPINLTQSGDTWLPLYAKATLGSVDTTMFNENFFFGLATGQFYSSTTPNKPQIVRVEFYDGARKIGESRSPLTIDLASSSYVYEYDWHRISAGTHKITAVATDSIGSRVASQFSPGVSQTVVVQVSHPNNGNLPPVAQIYQFASTDTVAPPEYPPDSPARPDTAANPTQRPVVVKKALPTLTIKTSDDSIGIDANLYYQLLLYRPDNTLIGNITPGTDMSMATYGTLARTSTLTDSLLSLDFTGLADGPYQLELVVTDGFDEKRTDRYTFALRSGLKLGQLKFAEVDYVVTTAGLPITISRAYDSSNPLDGDFGASWTFSIADLNVEFDEERTDASAVDTDESFSLRTGGGRDVTLTLPDGRRTTFVFTMHSSDETGYGWLGEMPFSYQAAWAPEPGVNATLTTAGHVDQDFGDDIVFGLPGGLNYWNAGGPACPVANYDIPALKLSLQDGTQYTIERDQGASDYVATDVGDGQHVQLMPYGKPRVTRIDKPDGEFLLIGPGGIDHYLGAPDHSNSKLAGSLYFERDQAGHIIAIHDQLNVTKSIPALVTYEYDGLGNLVTVNKLTKYDSDFTHPPKQDYITSTYEYTNPDFPHYLTKATDGRGQPIMINEYRNDGKLWKVHAADGRVTTMDYLSSGFTSANHPAIGAPLNIPAIPPKQAQTITEQIFDTQSGAYKDISSTRLEMDADGNVILSVDALGACTERWFDSYNMLVRQTIKPNYAAAGETTDIFYNRDSLGQVTDMTTEFPSGSGIKSREEYDSRGQMIYSADRNSYTSGAATSATFYTQNQYASDGSGHLLQTSTKAQGLPATIIFQQTYYDGASPHFTGLLKSTIDALNNETTYTYYDFDDLDGRFGDIKEVTQYQGLAATGTKLAGSQYFYNILTGARLSEVKGDYSGANGSFAPKATTSTVYDSRNRPIVVTDPIGHVSSTTYNAVGSVASTTDPFGATVRYAYDGVGARTQTEYPDGSVARSVTYYGPETGHVNWLRHVVQENRHFPTDSVSGTRTIYDEAGRVIQTQTLKDLVIAVALNGEVCTTTFTSATTVSFNESQYDFAGRVTMSSTPRAQGAAANLAIWTKSEYDENGRKWRERRAVNPDGTLISGTTLTTVTDYDKNGNQKWTIDPTQFAAITITGADTPANWRSQIYPTYSTSLSRFTFDSYNRLTRTDLPSVGTIAAYTETRYDITGQKWLTVDADRKGTGYAYDALGRLNWVVTDVDPSVTTFAASPYTLDSLETWARAARSASDSAAVRYQYDALGNLTSQTVNGIGGATKVTTFSYNAVGQRTRRKLPDSTDSTAEHIINEIVYSSTSHGHREIHVDFNGATIVTDYDLLGRVVQRMPAYSVAITGGEAPSTYATGTINPAGANNAIKFSAGSPGSNPNGLPVVLLADDAHVSGAPAISYDSTSDVVLIRYNSTMTASALISAVNAINSFNVTAALDTVAESNNGSGALGAGPTGDATAATFTYDGGGRRMQMIDNYGTASARTTKYAYDESGRLKVKQSPQGTLTYTYNPDGSVSELTARHGYNFTGSQQSLFNAANQTALWARTTGAYMSYTYDGRGRLYQVYTATPDATHSSLIRATYGYDQAGNLTSVQYPNLVTTSYYYNSRNALRYVKSLNNGTAFASFDYDDYDASDGLTFGSARSLSAAGLRQGLAEMITYAGTTTRRSIAYDYDGLNRLRAERIRSQTGASFLPFAPTTVPTTPATGDVLYDFTTGYDTAGYDKSGNRRYRTSSGVNMLTASGSLALQNLSGAAYDANDRMNYSTSNYDKNGNNLYQTTYISQQTPSQIVPSSANPDKFDLANRLTQRGGGSTYVTFIYDGDGNRVIKTSVSGGVTTTTHFLVDTVNPTGYAQVLEEAAAAIGNPNVSYVYGSDLISQDRGGTVSYYGYDGQGSVRHLTSGSAPASVTDTYTYDAYGILLSANGTTVNNYRYVGEQWDPELGMYYLRARYYHPDVDRFWGMDTYEGDQGDPLTLHKYLYCAGNPINCVDPSGNLSLVDLTVATAIRGGIAALTMGGINAGYTFAKTRSYSAAALSGVRTASMVYLSFVSAPFAAVAAIKGGVDLYQGIQDGNITWKDTPELASYTVAAGLLAIVFKTTAFGEFTGTASGELASATVPLRSISRVQAIMKRARNWDWSTPRDQAAFYSKYTQNYPAARASGKMLIEDTAGGKQLVADSEFQSLPKEEQTAVWYFCSMRYAQSTSGHVAVYAQNASSLSIFKITEEPILRAAQKSGTVSGIDYFFTKFP